MLLHLPSLRLPPGCRQLALVGQERGAALQAVAAALPSLQQQLPELRHLLLEQEALQLERHFQLEEGLELQQVAGRWRPTRLPGQARQWQQQQQADPLQSLLKAGVEVVQLPEQQRRLPTLLDKLAAAAEGAAS